MKFLSVAIVYSEWAAVFDLKISSWILLYYYIPMLYLLKGYFRLYVHFLQTSVE